MATKKQWYIVSMLSETKCGYESAETILRLAKDPETHLRLISATELEMNRWFEAASPEEAAEEAAQIAESYGQSVFTVYKAERAFTEEDVTR